MSLTCATCERPSRSGMSRGLHRLCPWSELFVGPIHGQHFDCGARVRTPSVSPGSSAAAPFPKLGPDLLEPPSSFEQRAARRNSLRAATPSPHELTRAPATWKRRGLRADRVAARGASHPDLLPRVRCSSVRSRQASGSRRLWVARLRLHRVRSPGRKASALLVISGGSAEAHGTEFHSRLFRLASSLLLVPSLPPSLPYVRPCGQFSEPDGHVGFATSLCG